MSTQPAKSSREQLRERLRQLILMRETGPKRAAWHAARARLIWRLHEELQAAQDDRGDEAEAQAERAPSEDSQPRGNERE